jgi:flagellar motor protein MotB
MRRIKVERFAGIIILAACMVGALNARAAQASDSSGNSLVPAKQSGLQKKKKSKAANAKKQQADEKSEKQTAASAASEIAQLKQQVALQQKQIEQLLHAVSQLQLRAATSPEPAAAESASRLAPQYPAAGQVASLSPVLPAASTAGSGSNASPDKLPALSGAPQPVPAQAAPKEKLGPIAKQDFKIGVTFFGGWSYYNSTGYGMQFMDTPTAQEPPGNNGFNTFEVNRAYVNLSYTPNEHVALRVTPDIYRQADGSYAFRLKYGYVDFQKIFGDGAFKNTKLTFGQTQQPLTDWEEGLSGYRYTYLTPWNFVSLSSTWVGVKLHGPIEHNGKEYLDYDFGVFNNASFHAVETNENKQFMVRGTVYPFGTTTDRTGLGFTIFNDYGYKAALPPASQTSLDRLAAIAFYQTHNKADQIAFEYEWGHNAFGTSNLFNGAGTPSGDYAGLSTEATLIMAGSTHQEGFALFGHARLGNSPFSLFGLWQYFKPNTDYNYAADDLTANPLDWRRTVGGISYSVTKQFDIAFGDENFHWVHPQAAVTGNPTGGDTNGIVVWTQFNY